MNTTTRMAPAMEACTPARIESAPRPGPTTRCSITVSFAGSAPARSRIARLLADSTVKLPEIWPEPPVIGSRITGAGRRIGLGRREGARKADDALEHIHEGSRQRKVGPPRVRRDME